MRINISKNKKRSYEHCTFQRRPRPLYIFGLETKQNLNCNKGPPAQHIYIRQKKCVKP